MERMEIKKAGAADVSEILDVLKASLGEASLKKNEEIWKYKHINNPFGESLVLIAVENDKIIGVRAFMQWKWQIGSNVFSAYRAVDTATHPDHQGKGVFKKLTLKALEIGKDLGGSFVFNTPNEKSKPGYLKMGWQEINKIEVAFNFVNPFIKKSVILNNHRNNKEISDTSSNDLFIHFNEKNTIQDKLFTPKSREYLSWRYENNPMQNYFVKGSKDFYVAAYIKKHGKLKELRVVEVIVRDEDSLEKVKNQIDIWSSDLKAHIISSSPNFNLKKYFTIKGNFGPVFTIRSINLEEKIQQNILNLENWKYSLGDLELF